MLDNNLFSDLETAVRWNVAATRQLDNEDPRKFSLRTTTTCCDAIVRTWEYAPTSQRIVQDINRVFSVIDEVIKADCVSVDFRKLRKGRRLLDHRVNERRVRRCRRFDQLDGLHPDSKECIKNLIDLT